MKLSINKILLTCGVLLTGAMQSCDLDEVNPGGFTLESIATDPKGFETLLNNCYFGLQRKFYNDIDFMRYTEGNTDLWTYAANQKGKSDQWFMFFGGTSENITFTAGLWNSAYDGIGACNMVLKTINTCSFSSEEVRNEKEAEARFLRAVYYYNLCEIFGGVVKLTTVLDVKYDPARVEPLEIYRDIIIPDLEYAVEHLYVGDYTTSARPTKKAALAMLAKVCLQSQQYTTEFLQKGYDAAKALIEDCESGGAKYNTFMYANFEDVFNESNNMANKEALWKYNLYAGPDGYGCSNGAQKLNQNDEHFLCQICRFAARTDDQAARLEWQGGIQGDFMPTPYLLNLFVQSDGSLDPRFHKSFNCQWTANKAYSWTEGDIAAYKKSVAMKGEGIEVGDLAIKFVMPQDDDYAAEVSARPTSKYLLVDYKDVYDDETNSIIMRNASGDGENLLRYYYPSLSKHNSSNRWVANASKKRNGNLNALFVMRMSEIYLIAAEYDLLLGGGQAMAYINKVRQRAGAKALSGAATIRTILDERGRELCGEFTRFYDLKRTGMFKDDSYLRETHPFLAQYFKPVYALRPIPQSYTDVITNGASFQNPGYNLK